MTDETALARDIDRAAHAGRLVGDALLNESFDALEADYVAAWRATAVRDTDARERLWQAVQVVAKVRDHLAHVVAGGKLAQRELDEIAARAARERDTQHG